MNRDLEESEVCTDENQRFGDSLSENREAPTGDSCKYKRHSTSVQLYVLSSTRSVETR